MESVFRLTVWFKKAQAFSILDSFFFFNWDSLDLDWDSWIFTRWVQGLTLTISNKITEPFHWASMLWKLFARPESLLFCPGLPDWTFFKPWHINIAGCSPTIFAQSLAYSFKLKNICFFLISLIMSSPHKSWQHIKFYFTTCMYLSSMTQ